MATPKPPGTISTPTDLTEETEGAVSIPNDLTEETAGSVALPNDLTEEAAGSVAVPNNLTEEAAGTVAIPNDLTEEAAGAVSVPNNLTEEAAGAVSVPNDLTELAVQAALRSLTPLVDLNFAGNAYAQLSSAVGFDDLFTYARASSATFINRRINNLGRYEYFLDTDYVGDVENLVTYSEQFDNAAWTKTNVTVSANTEISPFGERAAEKLTSNLAGTNSKVGNSFSATSGVLYTLSVYAKKGNTGFVRLAPSGGFAGLTYIIFDLNSGKINFQGSGGTGAGSIGYVGDGWYLLTYSEVANATASSEINIATASNGSNIANSGDNIYIYGAQVTESEKPLPYVKTLTAAVTQAFAESVRLEYKPDTGEALGALIEEGRTNLQTHSEQFNDVAWIKTSCTVTDGALKAPDLTFSATKIVPDSAAIGWIFQDVSFTSGLDYTASIYAKAGEFSEVILLAQAAFAGNAIFTTFDLANGSKIDSPTNPPNFSTIEYIMDGWYRISITVTATATISNSFQFARTGTGDGASGFYIWGAQTEQYYMQTSYIRTESTAVSRASDKITASTIGLPDIRTGQQMSLECEGSLNNGLLSSTDRAFYSEAASAGSFALLRVDAATGTIEAYRSAGPQDAGTNMDLYSIKKYVSTVNNANLSTTYEDGVVISSATRAPATEGAFGELMIGRFAENSSFLNGHIKSFSVYNVSLTGEEVTTI